jgi:hypothetical protein
MRENMDITDGFATSSKEHLQSLVCVHDLDEITSNGGEDRSATKEHPRVLKHKRPNFMHGEPLSWTRGRHCQKRASGRGKVHNHLRTPGAKGRPSQAGMGLGRSTQAAGLGQTRGRFGPPFLAPEGSSTLIP